ncbi:metallophosphoesterase family protein [Nitrolancea hollandica]|uniref:Nuclease SbcCD subunit D n=1 Tax=Nitrolancea hollandica Lb TaxID=1129897 RepID=I4ED17_9BACT|nr:exonuclease SbcCD subunit D [Nitrolancea hollandica]CCF82579.1 putative Nuclease SbcCD, subunit D [Nitrolancea hollandica Lb]
MKILHTADWHLGATWDRYSRRDDQERVLDEILALCDQHNVDLLLVAGDVFSDRVEGGKPAKVVRDLLLKLRPHLERGRAVFLLRGNHDPFDLFQLVSLLLDEISGGKHWPLMVAGMPGVWDVPDHVLQIVALPYLTPRMLRTPTNGSDAAPEAQLAGLSGQLAVQAQHLYASVKPGRSAIFAGHLLIRGAGVIADQEFEHGYRQELWLDPANLPHFTSYNALGHIHLSQELKGANKPTWYSGAPDRLNRGERDYKPQVLLVTTPDTPGGVAQVTPIPLSTCTPFVDVELDGQDAIDRFVERAATPNPLGKVTIRSVPVAARGVIEERIRAVAPRLNIHWPPESSLVPLVTPGKIDHRDIYGTVTGYFAETYANQPEYRDELISAFKELWDTSSGEPGDDH